MKLRILLAVLLAFPAPAWAEVSEAEFQALRNQVDQLSQAVNRLVQTVENQTTTIGELETENQRLRKQVTEKRLDAQPTTAQRLSADGLPAFNPDIGVVLDVVGQWSNASREDKEGNDKISARELELIFGHDVDPYTRLDATVTLSDFEEIALEEAYATYWGIPGLHARVGRLRPKIGKVNVLHRDQLQTVDTPLVIQKYLGIEGMSRSGVELSGFLPVPWQETATHELLAGFIEGGVGEDGTLFGDTRRRPSVYTRLRNYFQVSDMTAFDLGATYMTGSSDDDRRFEVNAVALDATLTHHIGPNNPLTLQSELFLQDRKETGPGFERNPWGLYALADYRATERFSFGGRFDWVEPVGLDLAASPRNEDTAWSGYLTFHQSEFARWRLQYQHVEFAEGGNDDRVFIQGTFSIGVHNHPIQ